MLYLCFHCRPLLLDFDICFLTKANINKHKHVHAELILVEANCLVFQ